MIAALRNISSTIADYTVGTVIVFVHLVAADMQAHLAKHSVKELQARQGSAERDREAGRQDGVL